MTKLRLRLFGSSPWRVAIINEADRMTEQAEAVWLDGLEHLPSAVVVIFTTNGEQWVHAACAAAPTRAAG